MRPRIGITTSTLDRAPEGAIQISSATHLAYAECIYNAGGLPLLLPNLPEEEDADEVLSQLDGVLFSGGGDIDPAHWGEPPHPALGIIDHVRDKFELDLLRTAIRRDLPIMGICRGVQVMSVATGGDLWQDIPSQYSSSISHKQHEERHIGTHKVSVVPDSLLANIIWPEGDATYTLTVNSFHHQAPRNCGRLFTAVAKSPDGIIEGLAIPDAHFALGVQWHPENMAEIDHVQGRLFSALITASMGRKIGS
ncbi:MAG TPA: gamma-glutamyl-gamma-aminobutyrate hydrolase family protein [Armatimonadota bacterium]|nr:gamma-glutamyl-gamma-aminobutyrate hydrolase family protein [Armatimonadota bacterium]